MSTIECTRCGSTNQSEQPILSMGEPWKHVVNCDLCGAAAVGSTKDEAWLNFQNGKCDLEVDVLTAKST